MTSSDIFKIIFEVGITVFNMFMWFNIGKDAANSYIRKQIHQHDKECHERLLALVTIMRDYEKRADYLEKKMNPIIKEFSPVMNLKK